MKLLLTNDDGIEAKGLAILEAMAKTLTDDITIVAPMRDKSGQSRAVTLSEPLRVRQHGEKRFSVSGTPADCAVIGALELMDDRPDLVLSGVNRGQNLAEDVHYSGTVGAAIMGLHLGIPSIALSQTKGFRDQSTDMWENTEKLGKSILPRLVKRANTSALLNVNLPDCADSEVQGIRITEIGQRDQQMLRVVKQTDPRNFPYYWIGYGGGKSSPKEGSDLWAIYNNLVSICPISLTQSKPDLGLYQNMERDSF